MVGVSGATSISVAIKNPGIYTNDSRIEAELTINVRKSEKVLDHLEVAVVCEEKSGMRYGRSKRREVVRKNLTKTPLKLTKGTHTLLFRLNLGDISDFPSSMDLIEHIGVFWWLEVYARSSATFLDQFPLAVFPKRLVDLDVFASFEQNHRKVVRNRLIMIASNNENATPWKPKMKVFTAVFGERYRHPENDELRELTVDSKLLVPEAGLLQSPHKAQIGLHVKCANKNCVILSKITVKLVSKVSPIRADNKPQDHSLRRNSATGSESSIMCLESEPDIRLPGGWLDLSDELADLEIPPVSETTRTQTLEATYELKITLVLRALHLSNFSRWLSIRTPINVFPSVIAEQVHPDPTVTFPPPPFLNEFASPLNRTIPFPQSNEREYVEHQRYVLSPYKMSSVAPPPYTV